MWVLYTLCDLLEAFQLSQNILTAKIHSTNMFCNYHWKLWDSVFLFKQQQQQEKPLIFVILLPARLWDYWRRDKKILRARGYRGLELSSGFWTLQDHSTHELPAAGADHTESNLPQGSSVERGGACDPNSQTRSYWQLMASSRGKLGFL